MKLARLIPGFSLLAVVLAACGSVPATQPTAASPVLELPSVTPFQPVAPTLEQATAAPTVAELPTQTPFPIATSRGPNLEATDPRTVSMALGGLQFVEFFEFW